MLCAMTRVCAIAHNCMSHIQMGHGTHRKDKSEAASKAPCARVCVCIYICLSKAASEAASEADTNVSWHGTQRRDESEAASEEPAGAAAMSHGTHIK